MAAPDAQHRPILLVGMPGSGKSTLGPRIAQHLGRSFVDVDQRIEDAAGRKISEIFELEGEAGFRARERATIDAEVRGDVVAALGGGAIVQPGAAERLAKLGTVVYLRASEDVLVSRIGSGKGRPMFEGLDAAGRRRRVRDLLEERESAYLTAGIVVDTDRADPRAIAVQIARELEARA